MIPEHNEVNANHKRKAGSMRIIFLTGGKINELGPYECGEEISIREDWGRELIASGNATEVTPLSGRPITFGISATGKAQQEINNV